MTNKENEEICDDDYKKWRENLTEKEVEEILSFYWGDFIC